MSDLITFLGAAGTVTGSKTLVEIGNTRLLVDCGLFQGRKELRLKNWAPFPLDPSTLDAVILTHAHIDHAGYLPRLMNQGFEGPVYCTHGTHDLCGILLPDCGYLQEEEAEFANRHGFSKHKPALPLFTRSDAIQSLSLLHPIDYGQTIGIGPVRFHFTRAGHIVGSSCLHLRHHAQTLVFTGDVGRPNDPIMKPPEGLGHADVLVAESTYGDRRHAAEDLLEALAELLRRVVKRDGVLLIPSFAVGRVQTVLHLLAQLRGRGEFIGVPIYLNSPMAVEATHVFRHHSEDHRIPPEACDALCSVAKAVKTVDESKALNLRRGPMVIIAGSGMATGGRILHHLEAFASDSRNAILFVGFQAPGTRGEALLRGVDTLRLHGKDIPIRAEIYQLESLSAHADFAEMGAWLKTLETPPMRTFLIHGEPEASAGMRTHLEDHLGWQHCVLPAMGDEWACFESEPPATKATR